MPVAPVIREDPSMDRHSSFVHQLQRPKDLLTIAQLVAQLSEAGQAGNACPESEWLCN